MIKGDVGVILAMALVVIVVAAGVTALTEANVYPYPARNGAHELLAEERDGPRVQKIPEMWAILHFDGKFDPHNPNARAYTTLDASRCTIVVPADKYSIGFEAGDVFSPMFLGPDDPPLDTILAHELLHCIRGNWHAE